MSKETEAFLTKKWAGVPPETISTIFDWFESVKSTFPTNPDQLRGPLLSFLGWFNGSNSNREKFDIKNIRDIRSYSKSQIKRLWSEFKTEPLSFGEEAVSLKVDPIFYKKLDNSSPSDESIRNFFYNPDRVSEKDKESLNELFEKSRQLWFGKENLVFEDGGFRVYEIPDQITSIAYGWYLFYMRFKFGYSGSNWCTTTPRGNNFFQGKRTNRSFYFIIDESKIPTSSEQAKSEYYSYVRNDQNTDYALSAFQIMSPSSIQYGEPEFKITPISNPGELTIDRRNIMSYYPKIGPVIESGKLKYVPWSINDQVNEDDINPVSRINETEGHEFEFAVRPPNEKLEYINTQGAVLRKAKSWRSMTDAMKKQYSDDTLSLDNMYDKFSNSELFKALSVGERKTLDRRILALTNQTTIGTGIGLIIKNIMRNDFYVDERLSLNKEYLSLYQSRTTGKFGIYNLREDNWVNHNGITYDDEYKEVSDKLYKTKDGKRYYISIYSRSAEPNQTSFYVVVPVGDIDGYFISATKWEELKLQLVRDDNPENTNVDYDPETDDTDITENRYEN